MKTLIRYTLEQIGDLCEASADEAFERSCKLREDVNPTTEELGAPYEVGYAEGASTAYRDINRRINALVKALDE